MKNSGRQKKLAKQQQEILKNNPNVAKVTDYQVWYTQTFKNYFCTEYSKGRFASDIFRKQGIDPLILGSSRVATMRRYYNEVKRAFPEGVGKTGQSNPYRGEKGSNHRDNGVSLDGDVMRYENGRIITDATKRAKTDSSLKGLKKLTEEDPAEAEKVADEIIKNTYRTLMTRGMKGCYVFCTDAALAEYLKASLARLNKV